jgi:hypothetical protein
VIERATDEPDESAVLHVARQSKLVDPHVDMAEVLRRSEPDPEHQEREDACE